MPRIPRVIAPCLPHHITQRGNGRQKVFFSDDDYAMFRDFLAENCKAAGVACWAYCLMPNHIHAILVPEDEDGLRAALAPTHRRYAGLINARRKRTGHFWQGRYGAAVMDEAHLLAAFRYILRNPIEAGLAASPEDWKWSSARAYLRNINDGLTDTAPLRLRSPNLWSLLKADANEFEGCTVCEDETIGRPHGDEAFLASLERKTGRRPPPRAGETRPETCR